MINLINANFAKLFKTAAFKICMGIMAFLSAFVVLADHVKGKSSNMDGIFNVGFMFMVFVIPAMISLILGQDYSDNVIRNKIAAGHSRLTIYISDLIVSFCAGVMIQVSCIITCCLLALPLSGRFIQSFKEIVLVQLLGLCLIAVYTALTTFITLIITNKTHAVVVSIMISMTIFMAGMGAYQYVTERKMANAQQTEQTADKASEENESRLPYILYEMLTSSQACILSEGGIPENSMKILGYDILSSGIFTLIGIISYRKKDLK